MSTAAQPPTHEMRAPTPQSEAQSGSRHESPWRVAMDEHFRYLLMWHGDFIRQLTLFEVERDGLRRANARTKIFDKGRLDYLASIHPKNRKDSTEPR